MKSENKLFYCTRPRLYSYLIEKGFTPIEFVRNYRNPKYIVWVFESCEKLQHDVDEFYESIKK